jgi:hypothetical protein
VTQPLLLEQIQGLSIKISSDPPWVVPIEAAEHFLEVGLVDGCLDYRQNLQDTAFRLRVRPVDIKPFFNIHQNVVKREYLLLIHSLVRLFDYMVTSFTLD